MLKPIYIFRIYTFALPKQYMKMMGVNPLSHFFAWFLECATYLVFTIIILTLVLQCGRVLPNSDGFLLFLYLCDYGLSVLAFSYLISSFFDKTYIAGLSGSLIYILFFFPFIVVMAVETTLTFSQKTVLVRNFTCSHTELPSQSESEPSHFVFPQSLFSPTCFSYAGQYISRYEVMGEGKAPHTHTHTQTPSLVCLKPLLFFIIRNSLEQHVQIAHCW